LLDAGRIDEAIAVFELNVSLSPKSSNAQDSLGESYEAKHAFDRAIAATPLPSLSTAATNTPVLA
jgi:hypothetical protein